LLLAAVWRVGATRDNTILHVTRRVCTAARTDWGQADMLFLI